MKTKTAVDGTSASTEEFSLREAWKRNDEAMVRMVSGGWADEMDADQSSVGTNVDKLKPSRVVRSDNGQPLKKITYGRRC